MHQNEKNDDNKAEGLELQLESSFKSSFRSTSTHLKIYDPASAEAGAQGATGAGSKQSSPPERKQNQGAGNRSDMASVEPPASRHAPQHSWLLGSHGGKKKPQAVRTRDGIHQKSAIDSATLAGLFSPGTEPPQPVSPAAESTADVRQSPGAVPAAGVEQGSAAVSGFGQSSGVPSTAAAGQSTGPAQGSFNSRIGAHPDDFKMPPNAKGALPPESYEQPDLYAATVEVRNPAASSASSGFEAASHPLPEDEEPIDETVAHLYSRTVDVNKPGKLTRFPEESLHPNPESAGLTTPAPLAGSVKQEAPSNKESAEKGQSGSAAAGMPPLLPPQQLSQIQSGNSNPAYPPKLPPNLPPGNAPSQFQSGQSHSASQAQVPKSDSKPQTPMSETKQAGWSPHFDTKPSEAESSSPVNPFKKAKKSPPSSQSSEPISQSSDSESSQSKGKTKNKKQSSKSLPESASSRTNGESNGDRQRKRGLPSYIDRQIGSVDEHESEDESGDDHKEQHVKPNSFSVATMAVAFVALIVVGVVGVVAYEGINSGGSNWNPLAAGEWKKYSEQAETAMSEGKYDEAIGFLNQAIKLNSGQAFLYHRRGLAKLQLHREDQNDAALKDLDTALKKDPKLAEALLDRAAVRIELGQFDSAIEDYDRLIKAGKDTSKVRFGRGLAKYYAGEYAEAEREFKNILSQDPDNVQAAIALGTTLYASKSDKKGAEEQFLKAANGDKSGLANRNLGILSYKNGATSYQDAKKFYTEAIDDNQTDANMFNERGVISWLLKNPLDATTDFRHAVGLDPTLESAVRNLEFIGKSLTDVNPKSAVALLSQTEVNLLKQNWDFAVLNADKLIDVAGWKSAFAYDGVLLKWVALSMDGHADKSQEVLGDCKANAGSFGWPMPLIKFLADDKTDLAELEPQMFSLTQRTEAHYYSGMNDYFKQRHDEARKKLQWVIEQGSPTNIEYPLAGKGLELIGKGGTKESEK